MPEIRNPNLQTPGSGGGSGGSGGDMRGTMIFAMLMLVVLLGYQYFFKPTPPAAPPANQPQAQQAQAAAPIASVQPGPAQPATNSAQTLSSTPSVAAQLETATTIENEQYKIVFTNSEKVQRLGRQATRHGPAADCSQVRPPVVVFHV